MSDLPYRAPGPAHAVASWPGRLVLLLSTGHALLLLNLLLLVPLLSWINYGHSDWIAWVPRGLVSGLIPAGLYLYWHFWYAVALPPLLGALWLLRRTSLLRWRHLALANGAALVLFWLLRLAFLLRGIRPDSV